MNVTSTQIKGKTTVTSIFNDNSLYNIYKIRILFRDRFYGGLPKSREFIKNWIEAKGEMPQELLDEKLKVLGLEQGTNEPLDLKEETEKLTCGFRSSDGQIFMRNHQIEALLKQCGTTTGITVNVRGTKGQLQHGVHVEPREIFFSRNGEPVNSPDGVEEIAGHVSTAMGKRSILRINEYVEHVEIEFFVKVLASQRLIDEERLKLLFHLGQDNGLGSTRSLGGGKFDVIAFEKVNEAQIDKHLFGQKRPKEKAEE